MDDTYRNSIRANYREIKDELQRLIICRSHPPPHQSKALCAYRQ